MRRRIGVLQGLAAVAAAFLFVWQQLEAVRLGYELEKERRTAQGRRDRNAYLRLELERTSSPARLAAAGLRLGMLPPTPEAVVVLGEARPRAEPGISQNLLSRLFIRRE